MELFVLGQLLRRLLIGLFLLTTLGGVAACTGTSTTPRRSPTASRCPTPDLPVYSLVNPTSQAMVLTTSRDPARLRESYAREGFVQDYGLAMMTSSGAGDGLVPVHRLRDDSTHDQQFTADARTIRSAAAHGYRDDGVAFYTPASASCGAEWSSFSSRAGYRYQPTTATRWLPGWHNREAAFRATTPARWNWIPADSGSLARPLYTSPSSAESAYRQATGRTTRSLLYQIAATPTAVWLSGDSDRSRVAQISAEAATSGSLPQFVLYNIPHRDCDGLSSGGARDGESYRQWIDNVVDGIGDRPAIVIVEPDAIGMSCLDPPQQQRRLALLRYAINRLTSNPQALVYLHAGSSRVAGDPTPLLVQAGVARARGIAVNVSGYGTTDDETAYADAIIAKLADQDITAHAVIDTSRNGIGRAEAGAESASSFCNQAGRSLGPRPTTRTGDPHVDAWLWSSLRVNRTGHVTEPDRRDPGITTTPSAWHAPHLRAVSSLS